MFLFFFFFFQAEDGIRDYKVTGVQTCALPISDARGDAEGDGRDHDEVRQDDGGWPSIEGWPHGRRLGAQHYASRSARWWFLAGSIALVGFGLDSAIEVTSSLAALWRLRRDLDENRREAAERRALRGIGICFFLLAAYRLYEAITTLVGRKTPEGSTVGIVLA